MSRVAVYTGSFDPLTFGHVDVIRRALNLCDRLIIGVSTNSSKTPLFDLDERVAAIRQEMQDVAARVEVREFTGLAVDFARRVEAQFIIRGLRNGSDLDYESPMAAMNGQMAPELETVFLVAAPRFAHIASSLVKDVARAGGEVEHFVPAAIATAIRARTH